MLIFYKAIDKSVFNAGFAIPTSHKEKLFEKLGFEIKRGESKPIQLIINNEEFPATITNINFDKKKYPNHRDILQIRYGRNSKIALKLQEIFHHTKNLIEQNTDIYTAKWLSTLPSSDKEFIAVYAESNDGKITLECIANNEFCDESQEIALLGENMAELVLNGIDTTSDLKITTRTCKVRQLSKKIGDNLKELYDFRCQICGCRIGEKYGSSLIHAHHIDYFVNSKNNDASNIMILCPNHHSLIHDQNPIFVRKAKCFIYPNGHIDKLKLNYHL